VSQHVDRDRLEPAQSDAQANNADEEYGTVLRQLQPEAADALDRLIVVHRELLVRMARETTLPDSAPMYDLESRAGDPKRQVKHLHQLSFGHCRNYVSATRVKLAQLLDAYLGMIRLGNPVGVFAVARPLLELHASIDALSRALRAAEICDAPDLIKRGVAFFRIVVRARYATKDKALRALLREVGVPEDMMGQPKIKPAIDALTKEVATKWVSEHYDLLCDYVHHNGPSTRPAVHATPYGRFSQSDVGLIATPNDGTQVTYAYGSPHALVDAVARTVGRAADNVFATIDLITTFPTSPFSPAELLAATGRSDGFNVPPDGAVRFK
jgi:hypothetical protein